MKININNKVIVNLTDFGKQLLAKSESSKLTIHRLDNGKYGFQLWELMQIFGRCMYNGMPEAPFVNNEIEIKRVL